MQEEDASVIKVVKALKSQLEEYRRNKPNLSVRSIAKNSKVNRYFLNKILEEDSSNVSSLDFSQVLLLSKFLTASNSLKDTIDNSSEEIKRVLLSTFDSDYNSSSSSQKCALMSDSDLADFESFLIITLASNRDTKRTFIERALSEKYHYKIDDLIEKEVLVEADGIISVRGGVYFRPTAKILALHLPEVVKRYFSTGNLGKKRCVHGLYHQNVNIEALKKIHTLHTEFMVKVNNLLDDEESRGEIPVFSATCLDSFISIDNYLKDSK